MTEMQDLSPLSRESEIEIMAGVVIRVRPLRAMEYYEAEARARASVLDLRKGIYVCGSAGFLSDNPPNLDDPIVEDAVYRDFLAKELAVAQITEFVRGISDAEGHLHAATPENIRLVMDIPEIAQVISWELGRKRLEMLAAKKDLGIVVAGMSSPVAVPLTAPDVTPTDCPVPKDNAD